MGLYCSFVHDQILKAGNLHAILRVGGGHRRCLFCLPQVYTGHSKPNGCTQQQKAASLSAGFWELSRGEWKADE